MKDLYNKVENFQNQEVEKYNNLKRVFEVNNQRFVLAFYFEKAKISVWKIIILSIMYLAFAFAGTGQDLDPMINDYSNADIDFEADSWKVNKIPVYSGVLLFYDQQKQTSSEFVNLNCTKVKNFKIETFCKLGPRFTVKRSISRLIKSYEKEILAIKEIINS
ncbi:hypothetical protein SCLARK_00410 [Spiroplasma clarkii]|nr:hypothetical protein [Spiroplasma clarkii]ARU91132.1 hypothetical protein SCLARK_00410 [Spiroplasma clarkii]